MTDQAIAMALRDVLDIERQSRHTVSTTTDLPDRDEAQNVLRHTVPLRRDLEAWIAKRALRRSLSDGPDTLDRPARVHAPVAGDNHARERVTR